MRWLKDLRIGVKLVYSFLLMALIAGIIGGVGVTNIHQVEESFANMYETTAKPTTQLGRVAVLFQRTRVNIMKLITATTPAERKQFADKIHGLRSEVDAILPVIKKMLHEPQSVAAFEAVSKDIGTYEQVAEEIISLDAAHKNAEALKIANTTAVERAAAVEAEIQELTDLMIKLGDTEKEDLAALAERTSNTMLAIIAAGMGLFLSNLLGKPIKGLVNAAEQLALGDLELKLDTGTKDEVGQLSTAFQKMADNLKGSVAVAEKVAAGDLSAEVTVRSEKDALGKSLELMVKNIQALVADANRHGGDFRKIVEGVNNTLDSVIGPLNVAAEYVDRIAKGDIPPKITDNYNGDFNEIKNNLNMLLDAMGVITRLAQNMAAGNLSVEVRERSAEDELMRALARMVQSLEGTINNVKRAANLVAHDSQELNGGVQMVSKGAIDQASAVTQVSASEQMARTAQNMAGQADQLTESVAIFQTNKGEKMPTVPDTANPHGARASEFIMN